MSAKLLYLQQAADLYLRYLNKYKGADDEEEILYFAADSYFQLKEYDKALDIYQRYFKKLSKSKPNRIVKTYNNVAEIYLAKGDYKNVDKWEKKVLQYTIEHLDDAEQINSRFAAKISFKFAQQDFEKYKAIRLRGSMEAMGKQLQEKIGQLPKINETFLDIIKFKDPLYASAALHMVGESFMELANTLFDAPVPKGLDEESQEIYLEELEMQAFPIEEKALEAWQKNIDNAVRLGIVNEWVAASRKKLEYVATNLAKVKRSEQYILSSSEFFYDFGSADVQRDEYQIAGAKVLYPDLPEGSAAALQEKYTFANFFSEYHKHLMVELGQAPVQIRYNGKLLDFFILRGCTMMRKICRIFSFGICSWL